MRLPIRVAPPPRDSICSVRIWSPQVSVFSRVMWMGKHVLYMSVLHFDFAPHFNFGQPSQIKRAHVLLHHLTLLQVPDPRLSLSHCASYGTFSSARLQLEVKAYWKKKHEPDTPLKEFRKLFSKKHYNLSDKSTCGWSRLEITQTLSCLLQWRQSEILSQRFSSENEDPYRGQGCC